MRIGNIDDIHKSQDADNLVALIMADSRETMTKTEKRKNWWYYYKWYVVCGIIILLIVCDIISSRLGLLKKSPDFQIAYVGESELPPDTVSALEEAFASLADDFNGDGEVIVQVNQYTNSSENPVPDMASFAYASEIALIGDIEVCESYFFLMEDPERIQEEYQVLAEVIPWTDCTAFAEMDLGFYSIDILGQTITGNNQELLSKLFIGRRCFYSDTVTENAESCADLWNLLIN